MRFQATAELHGRNDGCRGRVAGLSGGRKAVRARRELAAASRCGRCAAGERQTWRWGERTRRRFPGPGSSFTGQDFTDKSNGRSAIGIDSFDCKSLRTLFQFLPYVFCEDRDESALGGGGATLPWEASRRSGDSSSVWGDHPCRMRMQKGLSGPWTQGRLQIADCEARRSW